MGESNAGISSRFEFQATQLTWVDKVVGCNYELKSFGNYFFYEFAESVEKDDRAEGFWMIIQ